MEDSGREVLEDREFRLCETCSLGSRILSLPLEQWEATERFHVTKSMMIRCVFGNNYSGCPMERRVRMGRRRAVGGLCNQVREVLVILARVELTDLHSTDSCGHLCARPFWPWR